MTHTPNKHHSRRGNLLVGCGIVVLIMILLAGIVAFFVATNWRGWSATLTTSTFDAALTKAQIDPTEHAEIMVHIEDLMTRFENKEVSLEDLKKVLEELVESPVIPSAMVMGIDTLYINDSDLEDIEKVQGRIELARFTQGLFSKSINEGALADVLAPVTTHNPDDNDIRLNLTVGTNNQSVTALKSADEVSGDDLRELIAIAKAKADEAEITQTPVEVDLSDEIAKAIGIALGEIADDSVEETVGEAVEDAVEDAVEETIDDAAADASDAPATDDGP